MNCWKCGAIVEIRPGERIGSRDECPQCGSDLHSCRNCDFYDVSKHNQCSEPQAEWVRDKEAANYCDYLRPSTRLPHGMSGTPRREENARKKFDSLFKQ